MRYKSPIANMKQVPTVSAIASFVVDEQNQQNHIAHEALFQRTGNSECYNGIYYGGKKDTDRYGTEWASPRPPVNREDERVALFTNLNFKRVVGCQVFWPLKLWYFVWYVLTTKDNKSCRLR